MISTIPTPASHRSNRSRRSRRSRVLNWAVALTVTQAVVWAITTSRSSASDVDTSQLRSSTHVARAARVRNDGSDAGLYSTILSLVRELKLPSTSASTTKHLQMGNDTVSGGPCEALERESPGTFHCEADPARGRLLVQHRELATMYQLPQAHSVDASTLDAKGQDRLRSFGLPPREFGPFTVRALRASRGFGTETTTAAWKFFQLRAIQVDDDSGQLAILGSRAVVTYSKTGDFLKVLILWPPLTPAHDAHVLTTNELPEAIARRATDRLLADGLGDFSGDIAARYVYAGIEQHDGSIALQLQLELTLSPPARPNAKIQVVNVNLVP